MSTFVLVHGAWQASWCWHDVTPRLEARGHRVVTIDLPGHGTDSTAPNDVTLQHYVDALSTAVRRLAEPPIVVIHSMGGPLTTWAEASPNVPRALVYIAANIP